MSWIDAALWGLFGSFAVEGLDLYTAVRRHGCWPWRVRGPREVGALGYVVAELIRLIIGGGLAWAAAASGQLTSAVGALAVGVAAPLIVERLTRAVPLPDSVPEHRDGTDQSTVSPTTQEHAADQPAADSRAATVARARARASVLVLALAPYHDRTQDFAHAHTAFKQALHDFTSADLRDMDLTNVELEGVRWSPATRWPPGWADQLALDSVEVAPDVFEVRRGTAHAFAPA